tara:strand:+ start:533 stop:856 length:324 start_codon:yes stop_codon:yes gene_type:complete
MLTFRQPCALGFALMFYAGLAWSLPECKVPQGLDSDDEANYCMIHTFRTACLLSLGYDLEKENWTVMRSHYEGCTIRGCEQLLEETGALSEALFEKACNFVQFDRDR